MMCQLDGHKLANQKPGILTIREQWNCWYPKSGSSRGGAHLWNDNIWCGQIMQNFSKKLFIYDL